MVLFFIPAYEKLVPEIQTFKRQVLWHVLTHNKILAIENEYKKVYG